MTKNYVKVRPAIQVSSKCLKLEFEFNIFVSSKYKYIYLWYWMLIVDKTIGASKNVINVQI